VWGLADIVVDQANIGLKGSPTRVKKSFTKGTKSAGKVYEVDAREGARIIVEALREKYVI
jgi:electron transfer flavoprotein beta subunit